LQEAALKVADHSREASSKQLRRRRIFNVAALIYLTLLVGPWQFSMPKPGQDWSYYAVIAHALVSGWEWGRDVILTFGPLGILYSRLFLEGTLLTTAVFWILVCLVLAVNFLDLVKSVPLTWACVLFLGFALPFTYDRVDPVFFVIPLLAAIGTFRAPQPVATWKILLLVLLAGPAAMIKLTFGILSLAIFLVLDTDRALRKKAPVYTPVFLVSMYAAYLYAGQDPNYLLEFLIRSAGAVSGYSEAMQLWGSFLELGCFLIANAIFGGLFWYCEFRRLASPRPALRTTLYGVCLGLFLFVVFKQGFLRQDVHTINGWDALSAGLAAYIASVWHRLDSIKPALSSVAVIVFASAYSLAGQAHWGQLSLWQKFMGTPLQQLASAAILVADPHAWLLHNRTSREASLAALRNGTPLPSLDGSVDSIPSIQSAILAQGLDYRPRPTVQAYTAYSDSLIDANLQFLRSNRAPKYVIGGTPSFDGRYPSLADGPMWPDLFRLYEPIRFEKRNLLLQRRAVPLKNVLSEPLRAVGHLGQGIALPVRGPVFVKIAVRQTLLGRLAQLLFKPGQIWLTLKLANGTDRKYLLIPGIARRGFVLSPLIDNNMALGALSIGHPELYPDLRVVAFRIDSDRMASLAYDPAFELEVQPIRIDDLRAALPNSELPALFYPKSEKREKSNR